MLFSSCPYLTSDRISSADLRAHNIKLIRGNEPWPFFYLCQGGSVLYVRLGVRSENCTFGVPKHGLMPSGLLDTLEELLDCVFDRPVVFRIFNVAAGESPDAITRVLEVIGSEPAEKVLCYARGQADEIGPDTDLRRKADIAKGLVQQNPELADEDNSGLLLLLAQDFSERQYPFADLVRTSERFDVRREGRIEQSSEAQPEGSDDVSQRETDLLYILSEYLPKPLPTELTPEHIDAVSAALQAEAHELEKQSKASRWFEIGEWK